MTLGIDTDMASVTTHFKHLDTPTWGTRIDEIYLDCFFLGIEYYASEYMKDHQIMKLQRKMLRH